MTRILVTGATGQLGSELKELQKEYLQFDWFFADRNQITLDNLILLPNQLESVKPNIILNCGAYTAVDKAEEDKETADKVNHLSVKIIAEYALKNKAKLIHISTDYVFDGTSEKPLTEDAKTNPINVYGATKLLGEKACLKLNPETIIIRTSWVYSCFGNNFVKTMSNLMQQKESLQVVEDQFGSPTNAADLAQAIMQIVTSQKWIPGIYNYSNEGEISWYQFALAIKEIGNYSCNITPVSSNVYVRLAKRPSYSLLDKTKIKQIYNIKISNYKESLKKMILKLK